MFMTVLLAALLAPAGGPQLPEGVTCDQVRAMVAEHGRTKAIAWAMRQGYSWRQIQEAKRCLE